MTASAEELKIEAIELELLLEAVCRRWGADFRGYARSSLRRRVRNVVAAERLSSISALTERVLRDHEAFQRLLDQLSVAVTSMFRDPTFFQQLRDKVVPHLFSVPLVRVWCAGCATGEEVYSMAILLMEAGLYERSRIYATDLNAHLIERAKRGVFEAKLMEEYEANYQAAGGKVRLRDYFQEAYDGAIFKKSLKRHLVFAQHNLVTDQSFNEFNLILCRNVMIYFGKDLQAQVYELLHRSLRRGGYLCLGRRELLPRELLERAYELVDEDERVYRRRR